MGSFWNDAKVDPKRQYRWVLNVNNIPAWICKKVSKPSFTLSESPHKFINHTYYYPGKVEWEKVSLTLVDPVSPDASLSIMAMLEAAGYMPPTKASDPFKTISKDDAVAALGKFEIQQLDGNGKWVERWVLHNPWISSAKFGDLDYEGDELINLELEIRYDYAYIQTKGKAAGSMSASARTLPSSATS